jgi:hypothetical protein
VAAARLIEKDFRLQRKTRLLGDFRQAVTRTSSLVPSPAVSWYSPVARAALLCDIDRRIPQSTSHGTARRRVEAFEARRFWQRTIPCTFLTAWRDPMCREGFFARDFQAARAHGSPGCSPRASL